MKEEPAFIHCDECDGSGYIECEVCGTPEMQDCGDCEGSGEVPNPAYKTT